MHLIDVEHGVMGTSAVVGTTIPQAVGYAYSLKVQGKNLVVASFLGDGAVDEGVFHESMNFAKLKDVPMLFICENNLYAIHSHQRDRQPLQNICERARTYGMLAERIEDNDVLKIHERVGEATGQIRSGRSGPRFFECMTYRWKEHVGPNDDFHLGYRTPEETKPWIDNDQVKRMGALKRFSCPREDRVRGRGRKSPRPFGLPRKALSPSHQSFTRTCSRRLELERLLTYGEAIREATEQAMTADPCVIVMGMGVDDPKAIYGTTEGLVEKFGQERVFDTPLSEDGMTGVAIGAALGGLRPIHVHIRMDFALLAMNQLINMGAKMRYMYGGTICVPMVVRLIIGRSWGQGPQHSQALHSFFMHIPGLKVFAPTTPYDAKGCLMESIRDDNPVIFVEHRLLQQQKGYVPEAPYTVSCGKARTLAEGEDITLVGICHMVVECLRARRFLKEVGVSVEVIDPVSLSPLDMGTVIESVRKTGRLLVIDNAWTSDQIHAFTVSFPDEPEYDEDAHRLSDRFPFRGGVSFIRR